MKYELAKKLKDAGFPQQTEHTYCWVEAHQDWELDNGVTSTEKGFCACPTLSELIEACGDGFKHLDKEGKLWYAYNINGHSKDEGELTPEEAVAYLWLELNK